MNYIQKLVESEAPPRTQYSNLFDYDSSGNVIYQGWAKSVLAPVASQAVWAIKKFNYTTAGGNTVVSETQWAVGGESNIWNNRTSLTYQ